MSGNDFNVLPSELSELYNLEELFLNDETNFDLEKSIEVLNKLPKLKYLHLENDHLKNLPPNTKSLFHLERLYLSNNEFKKIPYEIKNINSLKYVDLHNNHFPLNKLNDYKEYGIKIDF